MLSTEVIYVLIVHTGVHAAFKSSKNRRCVQEQEMMDLYIPVPPAMTVSRRPDTVFP